MDLDRLNRWLSLTANLGVIAGLIFLAVEIQQNTSMMRFQTRSTITGYIHALLEMERHPKIVSAYKKIATGETLSFEEHYILRNMANATFRSWENSFYQNQAGLFEAGEYQAEIEVGREMMKEEHMLNYWMSDQKNYSVPFQEHVNTVLIQTGN